MTIWNLGGINADNVYGVPHIPAPGETLDATSRQVFLGGKGANMSVAASRAGAHVAHIGAVGPDGRWAVDRLMEYGVDTRAIEAIETETAHAMIFVAPDGENGIVVYPGANREIPEKSLKQALTRAKTGDWLVTQNEVNMQLEAAKLAKKMGLKTAYAAAPFDADITKSLLPHLDFLILNEVEASQLRDATGQGPEDLPVKDIIVTLGAQGATWFGEDNSVHVPSYEVTPIDTTGAGDTFTGYVLAGLDRGQPILQAMQVASKAAAIMVTRRGTADVIPDLADVQAFSG
ncbi:ribokinase [Octadecabacter sp. 1_MG-2023]|uniref:ribokinase n=1 Tax=unclassified Octadecabacter TaxID=196158 RepID=UPI001C084C36|nr:MULTISPECIES: ribokinase [unclassified Octadecabacter]MBU2992300.1 ribokinase [Octadecabacter sp. B2R22]MDO6734943.1 ribokinase [Octadecabacter sp. 1_MG-2023]